MRREEVIDGRRRRRKEALRAELLAPDPARHLLAQRTVRAREAHVDARCSRAPSCRSRSTSSAVTSMCETACMSSTMQRTGGLARRRRAHAAGPRRAARSRRGSAHTADTRCTAGVCVPPSSSARSWKRRSWAAAAAPRRAAARPRAGCARAKAPRRAARPAARRAPARPARRRDRQAEARAGRAAAACASSRDVEETHARRDEDRGQRDARQQRRPRGARNSTKSTSSAAAIHCASCVCAPVASAVTDRDVLAPTGNPLTRAGRDVGGAERHSSRSASTASRRFAASVRASRMPSANTSERERDRARARAPARRAARCAGSAGVGSVERQRREVHDAARRQVERARRDDRRRCTR